MPRSGKLPVLNLFTGQKSGFSPRRGDSLLRFTSNRQTWQNWRAYGSAWLCKISPQSPEGVGMRPPKYQNFHFLVKSRRVGATPWRISKIFRGFYTPNYATLVFQIWLDSLHRLRSYCWETARRKIRLNFSVHPVGKTMRWIEKWITPVLMASTSSITMQSLGKIVNRASAVGAKTWCLYVFFCHTLRGRRAVPSRGALFEEQALCCRL